ncbi:flagellar hook-length control protein FliK [Arcobacter cloacae]|uniref:Flagellar hook-length control protein FliK n=1 Tax=Arcobacter cloacae TaxID=1054034 RepID=A0A6M8NMG5_9BACT|nr:flagellar hook-length control protein FliK [Arcobacter cloacae]QKF89607.1 flagellar hook-length control protein FliK [Arcobacter cloacae]RXI42843.1 flagellar hook-length control protein FliK [Arcobacter cloacae]
MLVSNNGLLNILLPNDNKVLKDVLKQADTKSLEQMLKNNSTSVNDVLKELFNNIKDGTKSNTTIENILKNSNIFKDLGNVSSNLSNLLENISTDENLQKFKPLIENFLKNIKDLDANSLKEQLKNSGVFLESKLSLNPNTKLENVLTQIQNLIKDINTPQAKQVNELINKLLQTVQNPNIQNQAELTNNLKSLTTSLQNLNNSLNSNQTQNLSNLTTQLNSLVNNATLIESKIENNSSLQNIQTNQLKDVNNPQIKELMNFQTKELLTMIKSDILQSPILQNKNILPMIDNLLKMPDLFIKAENLQNIISSNNLSTFSNNFASNLTPLLETLKENLQSLNPNNSNLQNHLSKLVDKVEHLIQDMINNPKNETKLNDDMKSILLQMQDELASKSDPKSADLAKQIDKLLTQIDYHQLTSLTSNSNYVYLPFFWEMLEDGTIEMKKNDEEKFYCQINLTLKDFGKVDLMLGLYDKNKLDLTIYAQREHFKIELRDNLQKLKIALNNVDLIPVNIKLLDMKDEEKQEQPTQIYMNNAYNQVINSSIDIRV